jgi:hypothetical protein
MEVGMALDNTQISRNAYKVAEDKDIPGWAARFTEDGTFTDESTGITYRGADELGEVVEGMVTAFPEMRRALYNLYVSGDNMVIVQLALEGTHLGSLVTPQSTILPTGADDGSTLPWTSPLHRSQAVALVGIVRTAAIIVMAAASGMRASELMELRVGRRPVEEPVPGMQRFRIASKVVKGQPLGGTDDEWVVIEPVYQAVGLAEQLHDNPRDGLLRQGDAFGEEGTGYREAVLDVAGAPVAVQ